MLPKYVTTNETKLQCPKCLQFFKNQSSFRKHQADHYKGNIILLFSFQIVEANTCEHSFLVVQIKYGKKLSHPLLLHFPFGMSTMQNIIGVYFSVEHVFHLLNDINFQFWY